MTWFEKLDEVIEKYLPDLPMEQDVPMSRLTSFHIGGPARRVAYPKNREQLVILLGLADECGARPFVMGNGTNLLAPDKGLERLVVRTAGEMNALQLVDETTIEADAGVSLARLALFAKNAGLSGLEFAHGIPGSLGGAVFMNAGAYGGEMKQVVEEVTALTESGIRRIPAQECDFGYRHSAFSDGKSVILGAKLHLSKGSSSEIDAKMAELMNRRKSSQPLEYPSAGSTFQRPVGNYASFLIDQCGLKGASVGDAQVSVKHAGFVVNTGKATCHDVLELCDFVKQTVLEKTGYQLELVIVGDPAKPVNMPEQEAVEK